MLQVTPSLDLPLTGMSCAPHSGASFPLLHLRQYDHLLPERWAARALPAPTEIRGVSFVGLRITSAVTAGGISAVAPFNVSRLLFEDVAFGSVEHGWACSGAVDGSVRGVNVPALPRDCLGPAGGGKDPRQRPFSTRN